MKHVAGIAALALLLNTAGFAAVEADPVDRNVEDGAESVYNKLEQPVNVTVENATVSDALQQFAKASGIDVTLDEALARVVDKTKVSLNAEDEQAGRVLGNLLVLAGGLRYTIDGDGIYVSSANRLAQQMTTVQVDAAVEEASRPMTTGEATVRTGAVDAPELGIQPKYKWRAKAPYTDPSTGLTHFPAPPYIISGDEYWDPRYMYTEQPQYVRPEYRHVISPRRGDNVVIQETQTVKDSEAEKKLDRLLKIMEENPDADAAEILKKYREETGE